MLMIYLASRLSGYLLFPTLLFIAHLGGAWSHWGDKYVGPGLRTVAYTLAPTLIAISVLVRMRYVHYFSNVRLPHNLAGHPR
jgi:hypothetical protein